MDNPDKPISGSPISGVLHFGNSIDGAASTFPMVITSDGNVGIGTTTPVAKLEVNGNIKVGDSGAVTCDATTKGSMRYNNTNNVMEFCNGTTWNLMQAPSCTDTTPNAFSFSNQANQALSTLITSDIIQITGMNCAINTSVSGPGSPAYRTCSDAICTTVVQDWTTGTSSISSGQYMQLRQTSSASGGVTQYATIITGASASAWSVATAGDCSGLPATPPPIGTVCADGTVYAGMSPDGNVPMYTQRCDLGMTWDGATCTGSRWSTAWNNGTTNYQATGNTNTAMGKTNSAAIAVFAGTDAPYTSAINCENLNENGHTDWYLPAKDELLVLYSGRLAIKNFSTTSVYLWSSTEANNSSAYFIRFPDGYTSNSNKETALSARCVRR